VAATAPAQPRPRRPQPKPAPRPAVRPAPRPRAAGRPRVAGGVVWIVLVSVLLAGIVAINVAALRLNLDLQRLEERKDRLRAENATTASELSNLAAAARVEAVARDSLRLVPPIETTYLRVRHRDR
jgi:cell division protein FtsL